MEDGSELLRHSQGLSIEEEWNKIDGPPIRQVTAIVIGLGNVSIFCDINGVIWCNYEYIIMDIIWQLIGPTLCFFFNCLISARRRICFLFNRLSVTVENCCYCRTVKTQVSLHDFDNRQLHNRKSTFICYECMLL